MMERRQGDKKKNLYEAKRLYESGIRGISNGLVSVYR